MSSSPTKPATQAVAQGLPPPPAADPAAIDGETSVDQPPAAVAAPAPPPQFDTLASAIVELPPKPPERYGKYNLLERIGLGGMAEVWRAKTLGVAGFTKDLVIKRILPRLSSDPDFVRSFIEEAQLVGRLQHANIVQIFDFDKEGDTYYLAMELVEGRDLRQIQKAALKAGTWPSIPISIYLIVEALKGLHYAHTKTERGAPLMLVHRDVSPHNLLISTAGDVKLADFGIAKIAQRGSRTQSGMVKGKLTYMSPEQISGKPLDARTDIYAMGIVLWELLAQSRLFTGQSEMEVIRRVRDGVVPPPTQHNPAIPEALERIVMKMLAADREQRYQSAGDVARDLCALPGYAYEAQALGELVSRLFPEPEKKNWTQVLSALADEPVRPAPAPGRIEASSAGTQPVSRSNMASSDQKTQMAQEVPPEVARLVNRPQQNQGAPQGAPAAPPPTAAPPPVAEAPPMARTMMAQAPTLPVQQPGPGSAARTMMAQAPSLPGGAPPQAAPPPGGPPPGTSNLPPAVAPGGFAQGLPPPPAGMGGGTAPPGGGSAQASGHPNSTVMMGPGSSSIVGRPVPNPLPLRHASAVFGGGEAAPSGSPVLLRWAGGPAMMLVVAVVTLIVSNRLWPPATGSGGSGPKIFALKNRVQIITTPPGATVLVDNVAQSDKTPTYVEGAVGGKAKVKITLEGFEPREVIIPFTKDERPPLKMTLFAKGKGQSPDRNQDPTLYDDRPGTKTAPDPEDEPEAVKPKDEGAPKKLAAADPPRQAKQEEEDPKEQAEPPKDKPEEAAVPEDGKRGRRHRGKPEKVEAADKGDKAEKVEKAAPKGKGTLTITVRPWAIVYIDNKKIKQTPLRDFPISPGKHTVLLVNDNKGKRESIPIVVPAGGSVPIQRSWE